MTDNCPDEECMCSHVQSNHFSLGCCKCACLWFCTWEEYERMKAAPALPPVLDTPGPEGAGQGASAAENGETENV